MKKTYIAPEAKSFNVQVEGFLCTSYNLNETSVESGWSNKKEFGPKSIWDEE